MISDIGLKKLPLSFRYKNWRGKTDDRLVENPSLWFGSTEYHMEPQWLMRAWDLKKNEFRDFALKDIINFKEHFDV